MKYKYRHEIVAGDGDTYTVSLSRGDMHCGWVRLNVNEWKDFVRAVGSKRLSNREVERIRKSKL